jgi:hypothetical protein
MKMGEDTVDSVKKMFSVSYNLLLFHQRQHPQQELESKVSISLDAWTSSNQYVFIAIVAHYITNDGHFSKL